MALSGKALHLPPLSLSYLNLRDLFMKTFINLNTGKPFLSVVIKLRKLPYSRGQLYILTMSNNTNYLEFEVFKINKYHSMSKLKVMSFKPNYHCIIPSKILGYVCESYFKYTLTLVITNKWFRNSVYRGS